MHSRPQLDNLHEREKALERKEKQSRKWDRDELLRREEFIRAALQHRQGRSFFYWLLDITGLNTNPFTSNALITSRNCGQMEIGQRIQRLILHSSPELYLEMVKEQADGRDTTGTASDDADRTAELSDYAGERPSAD